jgi:hypothetical protein
MEVTSGCLKDRRPACRRLFRGAWHRKRFTNCHGLGSDASARQKYRGVVVGYSVLTCRGCQQLAEGTGALIVITFMTGNMGQRGFERIGSALMVVRILMDHPHDGQ